MSLEFFDGFDHYTTSSQKWDTTSGGFPYSSVGAGRFGVGRYIQSVNTNPPTLYQGQLSSVSTRIFGSAVQVSGSSIIMFFTLGGVSQCYLGTNSSNQLEVVRGSTVLATGTTVIPASVWNYVEISATIHPSAGAYDVHLNGTSVLSATGVNTANTGSANTDGIALAQNSGCIWDDLYILNTSGSYNNTFRGDSRVITSYATGDGATTNWTPSSGANHYSRINENPPDGDTSYVSDSTSADVDLYTYPSISPTGSIFATQTVIDARKDDVGTRQITDACRSAGTTYTGSSVGTLLSTYYMYRQIREVDPATGVPWTTSGINAAQFGQAVV